VQARTRKSEPPSEASGAEEQRLDCKGLRCPLPIVRVSQAMKSLPVGGTLRVEATDPAFLADIQAWAKSLKHRLVEFQDGPVKKAVVEKR
jgi:tRNA 2-thiouridine synthesizing protein A